MASHTISYK